MPTSCVCCLRSGTGMGPGMVNSWWTNRRRWEGGMRGASLILELWWVCRGWGYFPFFLATKVHTYFRTIFWPIFCAFHLKYYLQRSCLFTSNPGIVQHKLAVCCVSLQGWCVPLHCSFVSQWWKMPTLCIAALLNPQLNRRELRVRGSNCLMTLGVTLG